MESTRQYKVLLAAAVLVAGFIAAALAAGNLAGGNASAQVSAAVTTEAGADVGKSADRTLSVSGAATAKAQPNKVQIVFAVDTVEETAKEALDVNAGATNAVLGALEAAGVKGNETSTADFAINPLYEYSPQGGACRT